MSKPTTIGQSHNAMSVLANNADWDAVDAASLQRVIDDPREAGKHFTAFLKNGGRVIVGEPKIIPIDRSKPFKIAKFIGEGWAIEEQDERSLALDEVDITSIRLEHMLNDSEMRILADEKIMRLKLAGYIRLDAWIFQTLWENQHLIPVHWKEQTNGQTTHIFFDGTVFLDSSGDYRVLYLFWRNGRWGWSSGWLGINCRANSPSAVLAS